MLATTDISASTLSIFEQTWWLDAATDNTWICAQVLWDNRLVGWMPYYVRKRCGLTIIRMPPYTRTLAPRFDLPQAKPVKHLDNQIRVLNDLLSQLPQHARFEMTLCPNSEAVFPFVQLKYAAATTYTFRSPPNSDIDALWANLDQKTRNVIKSTRKKFAVEFHHDLDRFVRLSQLQYKTSEKKDFNDYAALARLWEASDRRQQAVILSVKDEHNLDAASSVLIWDKYVLYFLASARDPQLSGNGANSLQIWEALCFAREKNLSFDMDGYQSASSAQFLRTFGLSPIIRPVINRTSPVMKTLFMTRALLFPRDDLHYRLSDQ